MSAANSLVAICLLMVSSHAAPPVISAAARENLRRRVEYGYITGIAVGMVNADGRTYFTAGEVRAGSGDPITSDTLFEIGSITKAFTGTLLAEMVLRGEVNLTDPVQMHLPEELTVPQGNAEISLLHMATHRSGFPNNPTNLCSQGLQGLYDCYTVERLYEFINGAVLESEPGTQWVYSNLGFGLLGHALGLRAGMGYEELLRERILDPLGLDDTRVTLTAEQRTRRATAHWGSIPWGELVLPAMEGAGALHSTVEDLLTFIEHLTGLQPGFDEIATEAMLQRAQTTNPSVRMGLGWILVQLPNGQVAYHDGSTYGQNSFIALNRATRTGVVVLCNNRASTYGSIQDVGFHLMDPGVPLTSPRRPFDVSPSVLTSYEGRYKSADGLIFDAQIRLGRLTMNFIGDNSPGFTVHPESASRFAAYETGLSAAAQFIVTPDTASFNWIQGGTSLRFDRIAVPPRLGVTSRRGVQLSGTAGFDYDIYTSDDLSIWSNSGAYRVEQGEVFPSGGLPEGAFYKAAFPVLE